MNQEVNALSALGGTLIILGFMMLLFYDIQGVTPLVFVSGIVLLVAGIFSLESKK